MTIIDDRGRSPTGLFGRLNWSAIIAGALAAAAVATVLHSFAGAVGLAVSSTAPTWRDASIALWILSGVYLILVALASYGLGGYVAGWIRSLTEPMTRTGEAGVTASAMSTDLGDESDNIHGLIVWALATLLTALLLAGAAATMTRLAAPSAGATGPGASVGAENIIAYDLDRLLRGDGRATEADVTRTRAEAGRILLTANGHTGVSTDDRAYLVRMVAGRTNLAPPEAERRVDSVIASVRDNMNRARRATVILAFMAGAAALLGLVACWYAANAGSRGGRAADRSFWGDVRLGRPIP